MIGVGVAEAAGLIGALIRKLVAVSSAAMLTYIIVFIGIISSIASDAGYLVLIPLGAAAFKSVGRHPLAGHGGRVRRRRRRLRRQPPDHPARRRPHRDHQRGDRARRPDQRSIDLTANLYFGIGSTILLTIVLTLVTTRIVERSLGALRPRARSRTTSRWTPTRAPRSSPEAEVEGPALRALRDPGRARRHHAAHGPPGRAAARPRDRRHHRRLAVHGQPDRDHHARLPRRRARLRSRRRDDQEQRRRDRAITKSWAGLAGLLFLFLLIAQFIAYFNYSNMAQVAAVKLGDPLERPNIGAVWLLIGFDPRHARRRPHHAGGDREVGDPRADLHPALPAARRRAADGARRLPRRRLADEHGHADHGLLPADRHLRAALPAGRRASAPSSR